ncbi:hypothetical protein BDV24DRAFT_123055 [Aspergillus arachidicola]|uniref:Uncharacterized protein n=1 Tax=Aspergillus arachidicola TaxID=656916 RepID=A0A5N6YPQ2_9EURO|nr:hypothetical protein BDV24DRAFT_123055 [Aspergillus arachidicola]
MAMSLPNLQECFTAPVVVLFISVTALLMGKVYYSLREEPIQEPKVSDNRDRGVGCYEIGVFIIISMDRKVDREHQGKI